MATVTISVEDLQSVYSQLNFLRNYVGVWSLDWQEHVVTAKPVVAAPVVAAPVAAAPAAAAPAAAAKPVVTEVPEVVVSTPVKKGYF